MKLMTTMMMQRYSLCMKREIVRTTRISSLYNNQSNQLKYQITKKLSL
jgi:hypothetical protein